MQRYVCILEMARYCEAALQEIGILKSISYDRNIIQVCHIT